MSIAPRQRLNARQKETLDKLFAAGREVLEELGHTDLSIRAVAQRAGVSTATAYTYIASKDHLFAELFAEMLREDPGPELTRRSRVRLLGKAVPGRAQGRRQLLRRGRQLRRELLDLRNRLGVSGLLGHIAFTAAGSRFLSCC